MNTVLSFSSGWMGFGMFLFGTVNLVKWEVKRMQDGLATVFESVAAPVIMGVGLMSLGTYLNEVPV